MWRFRPGTRARIRDFTTALVLLGGVALLTAWLASRSEVSPSGSARIIDGDSLVVNDREIRLEGIDAPEYAQTCRRDGAEFPCGREAARILRRLTAGKSLTCKGWQEDQYERLLATCFIQTLDLNRKMVRDGWAVSYGAYEDDELEARKNRRGIWSAEFQRPSDWRKSRGEGATLFEWLKGMVGL